MAGDCALGPLDENPATVVDLGRPTNVLPPLILIVGELKRHIAVNKQLVFNILLCDY